MKFDCNPVTTARRRSFVVMSTSGVPDRLEEYLEKLQGRGKEEGHGRKR
jgi:hypothetical protein